MQRVRNATYALIFGLSALLISGCGKPPQTAQAPGSCDPVVASIKLDGHADAAVENRVFTLFRADQADRTGASGTWTEEQVRKITSNDAERRREVMGYLHNGKIYAPYALYHAAMIFQHGNCLDHYKLANTLAEKAMQGGDPHAPWLYAASMDRYLVNQGKPQKYGTQFRIINGQKQLMPVDPNTTDDERRRYNVPPLAQSQSESSK